MLQQANIAASSNQQQITELTRRARTGRAAKVGWLALALGQTAGSVALPRAPHLHAAPAPETAFLVSAAARVPPARGRAEALLSVLAQLEAQDRRSQDRGRSLSQGAV